MWQRAAAANIPAIEVRASDFLGQGAVTYFSLLALPALLKKESVVSFPGSPDAPHAWSFTKDTAKTLIAAARYTGKWGRAFHAPAQHVSIRDLIAKFAATLEINTPEIRRMTAHELSGIGFPEAIEMLYLFEKPFRVDAADTQHLLGVGPSSLEGMVQDTLWSPVAAVGA
jgi:nucleoside-diphosphate-sugar epimerase